MFLIEPYINLSDRRIVVAIVGEQYTVSNKSNYTYFLPRETNHCLDS